MKQTIIGFVRDVSSEMKKVSWPTKEQLQESTAVTIIVCLCVVAMVGVVDFVLTKVFEILF
ncbi:MAG: preprotein translocase subunit SecE [Chlorobi bacterium]|jgi:preprotein translocase subunit SecE|nr:preprotein translocase subunit SecE [Chlorobiota bacterium]MCC7438569.1 preprotein translocase subunit SecE [Armatimonadota bacterium]